ncbi:hypothetical protein UE99_019340 [Burkholderia cenocepacia]|nr:hypothetical protein [Burkholderia cenocepacia]
MQPSFKRFFGTIYRNDTKIKTERRPTVTFSAETDGRTLQHPGMYRVSALKLDTHGERSRGAAGSLAATVYIKEAGEQIRALGLVSALKLAPLDIRSRQSRIGSKA